ncbi:hypothetical protein O6H91_12G053000 [Diphasiastrum complanatum]|uniref:Uncharacterized protein n=2 Tax=Diphasiastrum complanatum TaxID=34168 RepID=A0ACC2C2Z7_DIPCM|nr:hypothetical protein O6H91_12G053000 [Diphasiastrum complanatum]KAJ7535997.1 hypothetical protein O6H91_12G053000 [Diphasiastrum complanatum]
MASNFAQWEVDPFFPAAEEVQNSVDRMESAFRTWRHLKEIGGTTDGVSTKICRRELITALDTAKWQVEEFERAVESKQVHCIEDTSLRHRLFVRAVRSQVLYAEKVLEDAAEQHESQAMCTHSKPEDRDSLINFLSGSLSEFDACSHDNHPSNSKLPKDSTLQRLSIANGSVERENSNLMMSSVSKNEPATSNLSTSADLYLKGEVKENLVHWHQDKGEGLAFPKDDQKNDGEKTLGSSEKLSDITYGCETSMSGCAPNIWTSASVSLEIVDGLTEPQQIGNGIDLFGVSSRNKTSRSSQVQSSDLKSWKDGEDRSTEASNDATPFLVVEMLKGASVSEIEQGSRIRPGNYQKVPTEYAAPEFYSYQKKRTIAWKKAVQLRLWMQQRIPHGRILQLISALLIFISFVGISII